jgi:uncharacterized protein (TIGR00369 family)
MTATATTREKPRSGPDRHVPFTDHLGIRRERAEGGEAVLRLTLAPHLRNNHGGGHGGVLTTLLDAAMAHAALSRVDYAREVVTVDLHIGFLAAASGDELVALGRSTGGGRSLCFCEARVENEAGTVVAQAMGTFRYREAG